mmetsp:Transcript_8524/g.14371  ORF Transcript_8524/g.14371 Transcript_8524/m.14371 type:complete len:195 (+) Transcript_8524:272-856(+)
MASFFLKNADIYSQVLQNKIFFIAQNYTKEATQLGMAKDSDSDHQVSLKDQNKINTQMKGGRKDCANTHNLSNKTMRELRKLWERQVGVGSDLCIDEQASRKLYEQMKFFNERMWSPYIKTTLAPLVTYRAQQIKQKQQVKAARDAGIKPIDHQTNDSISMRMTRADLCGARVLVANSLNPAVIGLKGIIAKET